MAVTELVKVDGPVRLVQCVGAICASVIGQARRYRDTCPRKQQRLARMLAPTKPSREARLRRPRRRTRRGQGRRQEVDQSCDGTARRRRARRNQLRCREGIGIGNAKQRGSGHRAIAHAQTL